MTISEMRIKYDEAAIKVKEITMSINETSIKIDHLCIGIADDVGLPTQPPLSALSNRHSLMRHSFNQL